MRGAFAQKDMPSAELLYSKAIDLLASLPQKSEAALYSNRLGMCIKPGGYALLLKLHSSAYSS